MSYDSNLSRSKTIENTNLLFGLFFAFALLTFSCNKDEDSSAAQNALTSLNLQGIWDLNLQETHPDIFICNAFQSDDVEWAYMVINNNEVDATVKLKNSGNICSGHKTFLIKDTNHLILQLDNGQSVEAKCNLTGTGSKLTFIAVDPGVVPEYPDGAYEVYYKRK
ncbi:MAG: hypothetical protein WAS55_13515 [Saprospiraceae bacterium]|nr:hypothetical protein [Saprospiraceae bacterium]